MLLAFLLYASLIAAIFNPFIAASSGLDSKDRFWSDSTSSLKFSSFSTGWRLNPYSSDILTQFDQCYGQNPVQWLFQWHGWIGWLPLVWQNFAMQRLSKVRAWDCRVGWNDARQLFIQLPRKWRGHSRLSLRHLLHGPRLCLSADPNCRQAEACLSVQDQSDLWQDVHHGQLQEYQEHLRPDDRKQSRRKLCWDLTRLARLLPLHHPLPDFLLPRHSRHEDQRREAGARQRYHKNGQGHDLAKKYRSIFPPRDDAHPHCKRQRRATYYRWIRRPDSGWRKSRYQRSQGVRAKAYSPPGNTESQPGWCTRASTNAYSYAMLANAAWWFRKSG